MANTENILNIRPVKRDFSKIIIGLSGPTSSGKTYTALLMAYGLAGKKASKVGLLDTENRRGSLYSDIFSEPFLIGDLTPPFSPNRYRQALKEFADAGVEVIVVDSFSHEWEGEGGCEEMKDAPTNKTGWLAPKREHKRLMNSLLYLPAHVILCVRAREKTKVEKVYSEKTGKMEQQYTSIGMQPITEKNVMFETTVSFMLEDSGKTRTAEKLPGCLQSIFEKPGYLGIEHGEKLRQWLGGANPLERSQNILRLAASEGLNSLAEAWKSISPSEQKLLTSFKDTLKDLAQHADSEKNHTEKKDADGNITW